jgi:hypothetical protein
MFLPPTFRSSGGTIFMESGTKLNAPIQLSTSASDLKSKREVEIKDIPISISSLTTFFLKAWIAWLLATFLILAVPAIVFFFVSVGFSLSHQR